MATRDGCCVSISLGFGGEGQELKFIDVSYLCYALVNALHVKLGKYPKICSLVLRVNPGFEVNRVGLFELFHFSEPRFPLLKWGLMTHISASNGKCGAARCPRGGCLRAWTLPEGGGRASSSCVGGSRGRSLSALGFVSTCEVESAELSPVALSRNAEKFLLSTARKTCTWRLRGLECPLLPR